MRKSIFSLSLISIVFTGSLSLGQDLNRLHDRVKKLWELRQQENKLGALQLVEPQSRETFAKRSEFKVLGFEIVGFKPSASRGSYDVEVRAKVFLAQLG